MTRSTRVAVYIGRFQPLHRGHLRIIESCLETADHLLVVIGSAFCAASPRNPFSWTEREQMIRAAIDQTHQPRLSCLPLRDYFDTQRWAKQLGNTVLSFCYDRWQNRCEILLANRFQHAEIARHPMFENWTQMDLPRTENICSEAVRNHLFNLLHQRDVKCELSPRQLETMLSSATIDYLHKWQKSDQFKQLAEEWLDLHCYKKAWANAPYTPIFVTADSIVECQGHVLLIRRGKAPGKGLWALPGGFLDADELIFESALRELTEETCIDVSRAELEQRLRGSFVCDHPNRSQRGRIITHAFHFDLGSRQLPTVQAADDAIEAKWVSIAELASMECQFHDDHFAILDRCFEIWS